MKFTNFFAVFVLIALSGCASKISSSKNMDDFSSSVAIAAAQRVLSQNNDRFYAYFVHPAGSEKLSIELLREALIQSAKDQVGIAVFGPNPALSYDVLKVALSSFQKDSLRGVAILYIGKKSNTNDLMAVAKQTGAEIRAIEYKAEIDKNYNPDPYGAIDKNNQKRAYLVMMFGGKALVVGEMK